VTEDDESLIVVDRYRKKRPFLSQTAPLATWIFLAFANFSFVWVEILPWLNKLPLKEKIEWPYKNPYSIWINLAVFEFFYIMALWAHLKTFHSDPGFIPRGYNYNIKKMTPANVSLFNYITLKTEQTEIIKKAQLTISRSTPIAQSSRLL